MPTQSVDVPLDGLPRAGDVIDGKIQLVRVIGRGGMGIVFEGTQLALNRPVAVKFMRPEGMRAERARARFLREACACALIRHPNVIAIYDYAQFRRTTFIVMPLLRGESLDQCLKRTGPLPQAVAIRVAVEILEGLHAAHQGGVIHRDMKPENVFLEGEEGARSAIVLDFGIAHAVADGIDAPLSQDGGLLGTPSFMSPEQARGEVEVDCTTDVYSVGLILYEMLAGARAFPQESTLAVLDAVRARRFVPLAERCSALPVALDRIVSRAVARDPAERFASAREFADALRTLTPGALHAPVARHEENPHVKVSGSALSAPPVPVDVRSATSLPSHRTAWGLLWASVLGLSILVGSSLLRRRSASVQVTQLPFPTRSEAPPAPTRTPVADAGPGRGNGFAAPLDASVPAEGVLRLVRVSSEEGARVSAPGMRGYVIARPGLAGDNAAAVLRVPAGTPRVCCQIPGDVRRACASIEWEREGWGHADCFAN